MYEMVLTINELYQVAANGETSWEHVLLLTGLLYFYGVGFKVSPPPLNRNEHQFYKRRINVLNKFPNNNNRNYKKVMEILKEYVYDKSVIRLKKSH